VLVAFAASAEGELADEQRHGEPDARHQREPQQVRPAEAVAEPGPGEPLHQPRDTEDADRLADHEPDDDPRA
jgi:hypothetical protein